MDKMKLAIGFKNLSVTSDRGGVLIGNQGMTVLVPNGCGDGETDVYILPAGTDISRLVETGDYWTTISGDNIIIYGNDCHTDDPLVTLPAGSYQIYQDDMTVALVPEI